MTTTYTCMESLMKVVRNLLVVLSLSIGLAQASEDFFWRDLNSPKTVNAEFMIQQSADFAMFNEYYSKTQAELRKEFVREAIELMQNGAYGSEALMMIERFDDRVYDSRQVAKIGVGKAIASYFRAEMETIYEKYETEGGERKILFVNGGAEFNINLTWGAASNGGLYAIVEMTNNLTGVSRSVTEFGSHKRIRTLAYHLASKFFHSLHKTRFPIEKKVNGADKVVFHPPRVINFGSYTTFKAKADRAAAACEAAGRAKNKKIRLVTQSEMEELTSLGYYHGGIGMVPRTSGWAVIKSSYDKKAMIVNDEYFNGAPDGASNIYQQVQYICAEDVKHQFKF